MLLLMWEAMEQPKDGSELVGLYQIPYNRRKRKVVERIQKAERQVEHLIVEAKGEQREHLQEMWTELAELELKVLQARTESLRLIVEALRRIEEELDDEAAVLVLM